MRKFNVYIVDQSRMFREGLKRLFASSPFSVVAESEEIDEIYEQLNGNDSGADFLLINWKLYDCNISPNIDKFLKLSPRIKIIILSDVFELDILTESLVCGAHGYLIKDISPDALLQSLLVVEAGEKVFPSNLGHLLISADLDQKIPRSLKPSVGQSLSRREWQILDRLVQGKSNKAIARELDVAEGTVKVHLKSLLRKIKARNRTQAAIWGLNHGGAHAMRKTQPPRRMQAEFTDRR